jgi:hypothetical protein
MKKKLKDTKIGKFLKEKAPQVLDIVGDVLPDKGVYGIVKNIISKDDTINDADTITLNREVEKYEIEAFELEITDRANARKDGDLKLQRIFAITFLIGYIIMTLVMLYGAYVITVQGIKLENYLVALVTSIFTAMSTKVATVTDFLFGGSVK